MSAIPKKDRETLSETEFIERVTAYGIDIRRSGSRRWFYSPKSAHPRNGEPESPQETVDYVRSFQVPFRPRRGEPVLKFVASLALPDRIGLAYTDAGKEWRASVRYWERAVPRGLILGGPEQDDGPRW